MTLRTKVSPPINTPMYTAGSVSMHPAWVEWFNSISGDLVGLKELSEQDGESASSTGLTGLGSKLAVDINSLTDTGLDDSDEIMFSDTSNFNSIKKASLVDLADFTSCVKQIKSTYVTTEVSITAVIPSDDTIPQISEGTQVASLGIIPKSRYNKLLLIVNCFAGCNSNFGYALSFYRGNESDAVATSYNGINPGGPGIIIHETGIATLEPIQFTVRAGPINSGTMHLSQSTSGTPWFGGKLGLSFLIIEYEP